MDVQDNPQPPQGIAEDKKNNKLITIIATLIIALATLAGIAYMWTRNSQEAQQEEVLTEYMKEVEAINEAQIEEVPQDVDGGAQAQPPQ